MVKSQKMENANNENLIVLLHTHIHIYTHVIYQKGNVCILYMYTHIYIYMYLSIYIYNICVEVLCWLQLASAHGKKIVSTNSTKLLYIVKNLGLAIDRRL